MAEQKKQVPVAMQQINTTTFSSPRNGEDGIAFGQLGDELLIAITHDGVAQYVRLHGVMMDNVAHKLADCIMAATRSAFPSMGEPQ